MSWQSDLLDDFPDLISEMTVPDKQWFGKTAPFGSTTSV